MFGFKSKKNDLVDLLPEVRGRYVCNVPLSKHTWFAVGGPAEVMYYPADDEDLSFFMKTKPYNLPVVVIGGGSNLLVRDGGIPGVVIKLDGKYYKRHSLDKDGLLTCGAGMRNADLKKLCWKTLWAVWSFFVPFRGISAVQSKRMPDVSERRLRMYWLRRRLSTEPEISVRFPPKI